MDLYHTYIVYYYQHSKQMTVFNFGEPVHILLMSQLGKGFVLRCRLLKIVISWRESAHQLQLFHTEGKLERGYKNTLFNLTSFMKHGFTLQWICTWL